MHDISLKLQKRELTGKKVAKLRKEGLVPGVIYGAKMEPILTQSAVVETTKVVQKAGKHTPVKVSIDGKNQLAIIKDIEISPVKHTIEHLAFHAINQNDIVTTEVPIVFVGIGESKAEKAGLVILQNIETVEVKAKPADLPESLEVSVIGLETDDDRLTLADIKLPAGVEFADVEQDMNLSIANVYEPAALEAANEAAAGDATDESEVQSTEPETGVADETDAKNKE